MRIYLASRYSRREELVQYRTDLERLGHCVTSRWLNGDHQIDDRGLSVTASDLVISFTEVPRSTTNSRGGRHVEHGVALGRGLSVWIVGPRENVFHCLPCVRVFESWADVLAVLQGEPCPSA